MNKISAITIADSIYAGKRITSYILTVPQIIVKELLRHRMFSFSSSSMRAIPFNKIIADTRENMFVPLAFQKHHSGMQGNEYLNLEENEKAKQQWISTAQIALKEAETLYNLGVTKQLCSRIIEPYGYAKILVTATEFDNFFELRCPCYRIAGDPNEKPFGTKALDFRSKKDCIDHIGMPDKGRGPLFWLNINKSQAEIHIQALAEAMWDAKNESIPKELKEGEWHIPFGDQLNMGKLATALRTSDPNKYFPMYAYEKKKWDQELANAKMKIATARCARLSYMTFDGEINYLKDLELHNMLLSSKHLSPFEHCARVPYNKMDEEGWTNTDSGGNLWSGNFKNWIQYRQLIQNV